MLYFAQPSSVVEPLVERMDGALGQRRRQRHGRPDERGAGDALRMAPRASSDRPSSAAHDTPTSTARSVAGRVHHRERVGGELAIAYAVGDPAAGRSGRSRARRT